MIRAGAVDSRGSLKRNGRARRRQVGISGVEAREPEDSRGSLKQEREGSEAPGRGCGGMGFVEWSVKNNPRRNGRETDEDRNL